MQKGIYLGKENKLMFTKTQRTKLSVLMAKVEFESCLVAAPYNNRIGGTQLNLEKKCHEAVWRTPLGLVSSPTSRKHASECDCGVPVIYHCVSNHLKHLWLQN